MSYPKMNSLTRQQLRLPFLYARSITRSRVRLRTCYFGQWKYTQHVHEMRTTISWSWKGNSCKTGIWWFHLKSNARVGAGFFYFRTIKCMSRPCSPTTQNNFKNYRDTSFTEHTNIYTRCHFKKKKVGGISHWCTRSLRRRESLHSKASSSALAHISLSFC